MKHWLKEALIFTAGLAVGGAAGWFITKKLDEKKIEQQVEEARERYNELAEDLENGSIQIHVLRDEETDLEDDAETVSSEEEEGDPTYIWQLSEDNEEVRGEPVKFDPKGSLTARANRLKQEMMNRAERVRYDRYSKPPDEEEEDDQKEVDEVRLAINDDRPADDIYLISPEQYGAERYNYDKVDLCWWEIERILSTEDYDILDVPDLLGRGWENGIGQFEKDMVYVRNEIMETDYAVEVKHDSFYEMRDGR